ncbi:MAG: hypothetical protein R8N23_01180 [Reichenbachiella sp.]|uniref:P-loop ATPase, Sll1717 family n=1 Tax=Reichenbachiella sp. TaxID=2184521 RepID=UPI002965F3EC|nr:hypothetical protein [Reichenbachiella sp.]MDW3208449.1 hypothetical protein [Reichenbachiella sp.]
MENGFFAYGSQPASSGESISKAVSEINKAGDVHIRLWTDMNVNGKRIISEIFKEINNADFLCADLTGMNENVLFEIGYALAIDKPIFLIFDISITDSFRLYKELNLLENIGYHSYSNSADIVNGFYEFLDNNNKGMFDTLVKTVKSSTAKNALFYVKGQYVTEYSRSISNIIGKLPTIVDDALENKVETLSWYIEQLLSCPALLVEFSSYRRNGFKMQNAKCSLISGIGAGLDKDILMVCEKPHDTPIDLKDLIRKYNTVSECEKIILPFVSDLNQRIAELLLKTRKKKRVIKEQSELQKINFGEIVAEHENDKLFSYFVQTSHLDSLIKNEYNLIIGRKGTGKSASLIYLNEILSDDSRKYVCLIKPVNFEIDGITQLLKKMPEDYEKSFLIESVWKFLIYTEIAKMLYFEVKSKPIYAKEDADNEYLSFIENNENLYLNEISIRLEEQLNQLEQYYDHSENLSQKEFKLKVAELLHIKTFSNLRKQFANIVEDKNEIIVLIDNLDKSWTNSSTVNLLSKCILGLLSVTGRIAQEISVIKSKQKNIRFRLAIFLRSDIFKYVLKFAREPDKIEYTKLKWTDPEAFFRIIEERFVQLNDSSVDGALLWDKYVTNHVQGEKVKDFIMNRVYPRPRDIIYFFKKAQEKAILRGHIKIEENDLLEAYKDYSSWVFTSLVVENGISFQQMEDFLYSLIGVDNVISETLLMHGMEEAKIQLSPEKNKDFINHLVSLSVIGREIRQNEYAFEFDFDESKKNYLMSQKLGTDNFKIHPALYPFLEIKGS